MKKVAIIGSVGVPANYGGFETLVENIIGRRSSHELKYTVFCSTKNYYYKIRKYKGASLKYIKLSANGAMSVLYDGFSLFRCLSGYDAVVALGVSGGLFFPLFKLFSGTKLIVNIDGLEWKRGKWKGFAKWYLRFSEELAIRFSDVVIADNQAIVDYVNERYKKQNVLITYGGDHVIRKVSEEETESILNGFGVKDMDYAVAVCRIEPENNCDMILRAFSQMDKNLVMVGNWSRSNFGKTLKDQYRKVENIKLIDATYDLDQLYVLRANAKYYVHGHSAGGTNPSLIEAMFCGCNILAYDVEYNRLSTDNKASYFTNESQICSLLEAGVDNAEQMTELAEKRYCWEQIAEQYEQLY